MHFENLGFQSLKGDLNRLDDVMKKHGMVRAEQWDYERVSYDRKFTIREGVYYLRVQAYAVEGDVDTFDALMQLMTPLLGKYYYPHGVEYGEDEHFPNHLVKQCEQLLKDLKKEIEVFAE